MGIRRRYELHEDYDVALVVQTQINEGQRQDGGCRNEETRMSPRNATMKESRVLHRR